MNLDTNMLNIVKIRQNLGSNILKISNYPKLEKIGNVQENVSIHIGTHPTHIRILMTV